MTNTSGDKSLFDRNIDTWVFDLDNTLYPFTCRLFEQVSKLITAYVSDCLSLDAEEAKKVQRAYFLEHGTTLKGLMVHHQIDPEHYLNFVHNIDYSVLPKQPDLAAALSALPGRRLIFTAASHGHTKSALRQMGLEELFEGVFDIKDATYVPKPQDTPYDLFFEKFDVQGKNAAFFEDTARNLEPAKKRGMTTVYVKTDSAWAQPSEDTSYIDFATDNLTQFLTDGVVS